MSCIAERIKKVISADKQYDFENLKELMKSDEYYLLKNYFDIDFENIRVHIEKCENGEFNINIVATANRVKLPKTLI